MRTVCAGAALVLTAVASLIDVSQSSAAEIPTPKIVSVGPYLQPFEHSFVIHSDRAKRDVLVDVFSPHTGVAKRQLYPVIYTLDAGYDLVGPAVRVVADTMRPAFVVTIGYPANSDQPRMVDMLHRTTSLDGRAIGGGGAAFEAFLLEELRPYVEAHYPVDHDKSILMGHSASALFAANVLADHPDAFFGYILASPSLQYDDTTLARIRTVSTGMGRRVFVSAGELETARMLDGERALAEALEERGFEVRSQVFGGVGHSASYMMLPLAAFPFLLPKDTANSR